MAMCSILIERLDHISMMAAVHTSFSVVPGLFLFFLFLKVLWGIRGAFLEGLRETFQRSVGFKIFFLILSILTIHIMFYFSRLEFINQV